MNLHFIAIGGAIMHQLAIVSHKSGHKVSGSDDEIADPARTNLLLEQLLPDEMGWFPEKITKDVDAVILGMHAKDDNPELLKAKSLRIPIYSFPQYIYLLSKNKKRIVVAGSHGKTTTTSMIMHVLKDKHQDFDYLVGAKVEGFEHSVKISEAPIMIIEGDEYLSSALDKVPKFHFYQPHVSVITGIAWDHVNVFPSYENYREQFKIFLDKMEKDATVIYNVEDPEVVNLISNGKKNLNYQPYHTPSVRMKDDKIFIRTDDVYIPLQIFGKHNLQNMEAARLVCNTLGISEKDFYSSICKFKGAARRLEKLQDKEGFISFRDFAHAPSKLAATLQATRDHFPDQYLIACFELHTYSSLNETFLHQYANSMDSADVAAVFYSIEALAIKKLPHLTAGQVKSGFSSVGLQVFQDKSKLRSWIQTEINMSEKPVCLLLMSSGTFEGMDLHF